MAGVGKVKALQIWCKNRVAGYRDVEITNMTTSWRSGMAFCALIHRFRPELIDYDSLSKENVFENNELAFSVAEGIGVPALLDAEDMVRLEVPDKLSIITYVAQLHNCFKDEVAAGGPGVKTASKRPSAPVQRSVTMRSPESKRRPKLGVAKKSESSPAVGSAPEMCELCDGKVYLIEKHMVDGKLYHRSCFKRSNHKPDVSSLSASHKTSQKSTPGRPSALPSKDLKKTPSSLPSTPNTPPDTRPDWQKKLQEKSLAKRVAASAMPRSGSLETLPEDHAAAPAAKPSPALQTVKLRSKASNASKTPTPRAVSVGVDLDERIVKLRQLRESAKAASSGAGNAAVKARLERLQKIASKECAADTKKAQSSKSTTQNETAADRRSARIHDRHKDSSKLEQVDGQSSMETSMEAESELPSSQTHTEGSSKNKDNVQFNSQNDACVDNKPSSDLPKSEENTNPFETETEEKPTDTLIEAGEVSTRSNDEPLVNRTRVVINTPSEESILTVESGQPTIETAAPAVPSAAPSSAPIRPKRSHNMKARPASDSPSKDVTSHSKQSAGAADGASSSHTGLTSNFLDVASKPKPVRPPRSPAASKRQNKNADTHSQVLSPEIELSQQVAHNIDNSQPKKLESESTSSVSKVKVAEGKIETPSHKMSNQKSQVSTDKERSTTPPARPRTNAAGSASKSHFYMDKEHKTVTEPPPKPARQPALSKELGDWQESLVNWSAKRKGKKEKTEKPHSTFYMDAYPTENNPFGEDDEDVMPEVSTTNQNNSEKVSDGYEAALNPFAEDSSPANPFEEEEDTTPVELPTKHKVKLMPGNPFEVSDDDDDEPKEEVSKRKITPDSDLFIEQPKTTRTNRHNKIILPDTSDRKITPKKKLAPPPPTPPSLQNRLSEEQTPVISDDKENTTVTLQESKQTINETTPTDKFIEQDESKFHDISDDEGVSIESQKRKHRPAPPRPMPPKRRPPTNYGVGPEELAKELAAIEDKQRHLEEEGRRLEKAIRTADEAMDKHSVSNADDDDELISRWLETVNEKNHLVRREAELVFIAKHQALESQQADLEWELREIMNQAENLKTDDDKLREEDLLQKLVTVVTERSKLVDKMDEERLRQQDEDKKIEMVLGSGKSGSPASAKNSSLNKKAEKKGKKDNKFR